MAELTDPTATDTTTGATGEDTIDGGGDTTTTTPKVLTEQQKQDVIRISLIKTRIRNGEVLVDDDFIFYKLKDSVVATTVMQTLDNGGGYDALRLLGLTDGMATEILGIYNLKIETAKYEAELGIDALQSNPLLVGEFLNYLAANSIEMPTFVSMPLFTAIRSNPQIYGGLRQWHKSRATA